MDPHFTSKIVKTQEDWDQFIQWYKKMHDVARRDIAVVTKNPDAELFTVDGVPLHEQNWEWAEERINNAGSATSSSDRLIVSVALRDDTPVAYSIHLSDVDYKRKEDLTFAKYDVRGLDVAWPTFQNAEDEARRLGYPHFAVCVPNRSLLKDLIKLGYRNAGTKEEIPGGFKMPMMKKTFEK